MEFVKIEKKWQKEWEKKKAFVTKEELKTKSKSKNVGKDKVRKKAYVLEMYPYPSASGLHMGHAFNYVLGDIYARFKRMRGFNVLYPMGYDSFGLPAENAAIKANSHPKKFTNEAIKNFISQQKALGLSYDWNRMLMSHDTNYYKWNQYFFLKFLENGLAYRKKAPVNWCEKCQTVLANEQVHSGKCWRHSDTDVEIKHLEQWFFKTTKYAEELLTRVDELDWPERIKIMQRNWIGKSKGTEILFEIENLDNKENKNISNVVIVHGCPDANEPRTVEERTYDKHWRLWLKENLEKKRVNVDVPLMPEPWEPNYKRWKKEFDKIIINKDSILVGHSCGCAFLVRWLGDTKKKIKKLILIAPWKIPYRKDGSDIDFYDYKIDDSVKRNVRDIIIFTSNDEDEDGKKSVRLFEKDIGGEIIELKNHGHYTFGDMGTYEFPELLVEILSNSSREKWPIFTTRPDTIFGVTFMVVSSQHPRLMELVTKEQKKEVENFLRKIKTTKHEDLDLLEKEGVFTGSYAINPLTNEKVPIWIGNFVVADYGSGMVMAVPAHDQRDFEFAKKYGIPMKQVIQLDKQNKQNKQEKINIEKMNKVYEGAGVLINSGEFNDLFSEEAKVHITKVLENKKLGKETIQYKLKDWLISRQRYWGTPIPIVYCNKCGIVPIPEKQLPVLLPEKVEFGKGNPLANSKSFVNVKCPKCKGNARRETDTMDTFVDSSWYYLRYCDNKNNKKPFDIDKINYWMPVDQYIGGAEHACMHLIYARFFTKALNDLGFLNKSLREPFKKLFNQGMLHGNDGIVMSKSRGNVILPQEVSKKYGIDTARLFLVSVASPNKDTQWSDKGIEGMYKFTKKVYSFFNKMKFSKSSMSSKRLESRINKTIKEITKEIENFDYNLAVIRLRQLFELIENEKEISKKDVESFLKLLSVFAPHISEELWQSIGNKTLISLEKWSIADDKKIDSKLEESDKLINQTVNDVLNILNIIKEREKREAKKIYIYTIPNEKELYNEEELGRRIGKDIEVYASNDKALKGSQEKAKKARPGKPGIYVE